jgi:hypothetical protein
LASNSDRFDLLQDQYGGKEEIPNAALYEFLLSIKEDLINLAKLGLDTIPNSPLGKEVRRRSIFDIKWLAQYFLWDAMPASDGGCKPVTDNIFIDPQYDSFADLFTKKDPDVPIHKLSSVKTRLLLWPRGGAKSSYDHVDTVQWILAYPSIRILYLTAEASLSIGFISEVKSFFTLREDTPTLMNLFFPEFCCLDKDMRKGNLFDCPVYKAKKIKRKESTVIASSVGKTKSGWHYEVIKADDAVSDKNTETETQCQSVSEKLFLAENLLIPGGDGFYIFYIGTRYHDLDHYGALLEKYVDKGEVEVKEGVGWKFYHNKTFSIDMLIGKACQIIPEVADRLSREGRPVTYTEAGPEGCILLLPNIMSFSFFMSKFSKNERVTEGQLNQNPRTTSDVEFNRMMMLRATVPFHMLPREGPCCQFWDFAFSKKKGRDYSTGASIIWTEEDELRPDGTKTGNKRTVGYVRKIIRDRFNHSTLAQAIVDLAQQEQPFIIGIEDAAGSRFLEPTIISAALRTQDPRVISLCSNIDWVSPDNQVDAKRVRMRSMYPWVAEGRLKFLNACMAPKEPNLEVFYSEWERCLVAHHHDDIPDVISQMPNRYAPKATQAIVEHKVDMFSRIDRIGWGEIFDEEKIGRAAWYYDDNGKLVPAEPEQIQPFFNIAPEPEVNSQTPHGFQNVLGAGMWG